MTQCRKRFEICNLDLRFVIFKQRLKHDFIAQGWRHLLGEGGREATWFLTPASSTIYACYSITNAKCVGSPWGINPGLPLQKEHLLGLQIILSWWILLPIQYRSVASSGMTDSSPAWASPWVSAGCTLGKCGKDLLRKRLAMNLHLPIQEQVPYLQVWYYVKCWVLYFHNLWICFWEKVSGAVVIPDETGLW